MQTYAGGSLFTTDYLENGITRAAVWTAPESGEAREFRQKLAELFENFAQNPGQNEAQTEEHLIRPILNLLGWNRNWDVQANLSTSGRADAPDMLLYAGPEECRKAQELPESERPKRAACILEAKRWQAELDRASGASGSSPASQLQRYLRRTEETTAGALRWGILTNGRIWRLYYGGARSVSENFLEIRLDELIPKTADLQKEEAKAHVLAVFLTLFSPRAFQCAGGKSQTPLQLALADTRHYEQRLTEELTSAIYQGIFVPLAENIHKAAREDAIEGATVEKAGHAALALLFRLLFIFYAEDRGLLPVDDPDYGPHSLRIRLRLPIRDNPRLANDRGGTEFWEAIRKICQAVDRGDKRLKVPPYNGGLFSPKTAPLLEDIRLYNRPLCLIVRTLSYEKRESGSQSALKYINFRDLGVRQLGAVYEKLLEYRLREDENGDLVAASSQFGRKGTGTYYTPDVLVDVVLKETIQPLIDRIHEDFEHVVKSARSAGDAAEILRAHDPAEKILALKLCDPAMGSGHFLVSLTDFLADKISDALAEAPAMAREHGMENYASPLNRSLAEERDKIAASAEQGGWKIDPGQMEDRHLIRRRLLKSCLFGVDKNEMAVELAKLSLWLHCFTVGAPLSFLDHHLQHGDALFGLWIKTALDQMDRNSSDLLEQGIHQKLEAAVSSADQIVKIEHLADATLADVQTSKKLFDEAREKAAPLNSLLKFLTALNWLKPAKGVKNIKTHEETIKRFLRGDFGDPAALASGALKLPEKTTDPFKKLYPEARRLMAEEAFLNWQVAFPSVWKDWRSGRHGGFDAVLGNPPWERMKLQEVEWFAEQDETIALASKKEREKLVKKLMESAGSGNAELKTEFEQAKTRAAQAMQMARACGDYPLMSGGDINLYSLFAERGLQLVNENGLTGFIVPSGIAADKSSARFFRWLTQVTKKDKKPLDSSVKISESAKGSQGKPREAKATRPV